MFDLRAVVLSFAVAVCVFSAGALCSPYYQTRPYSSGNYLQPNNQIVEILAHETHKQNTWLVNSGYAQPVYNPHAAGYLTYPNHGSYKVHRYGATWHEAMQVCAAEGATLAIVTSQAEANLIKTLFQPHVPCVGALNNSHFWVGAQERGVNGQFYTIVGVRLEQSGYYVWGFSQPNDPGNADCVSIFADGSYFDDQCTSKYAFVCEKFTSS